jgi:hypothetical protein
MIKDLEKTKQSLIDLLSEGINPFGKPNPNCDKCALIDDDEDGVEFYYCSCEEVKQ